MTENPTNNTFVEYVPTETDDLKEYEISVDQLCSTWNNHKTLSEDLQKECNEVGRNLTEIFHKNIIVTVVEADNRMSIVSIFPELSTLDLLVTAMYKTSKSGNKQISYNEYKKIIQSNKTWYIEISTIALKIFTPEELSAVLFHEVGHTAEVGNDANLWSYMKFVGAQSNAYMPSLAGDKAFSKIMSLPVIEALNAKITDKKNIRKEINADKTAVHAGYAKPLESALNKMIDYTNSVSRRHVKDDINITDQYAQKMISDFYKRRDKIAKRNLILLRRESSSDYINNMLDDVNKKIFEGTEDHIDKMHERVEDEVDEYYMESIHLPRRKLDKIPPLELDYIRVTINKIQSENDRLMVISYIHSKLDKVDYYISLAENPKTAKKYVFPQSIATLHEIQNELYSLRKLALNKKISKIDPTLLVQWPTGYEG